MMSPEYVNYLPSGPSDSAAIREVADKKYAELISAVKSGIDRNNFLSWSNNLTKELLGAKNEAAVNYKQTGATSSTVHHSIYEFDKDNDFGALLTEDMKIPSQTSLDKLKKSRMHLEQYLSSSLPSSEPTSSSSSSPTTGTAVFPSSRIGEATKSTEFSSSYPVRSDSSSPRASGILEPSQVSQSQHYRHDDGHQQHFQDRGHDGHQQHYQDRSHDGHQQHFQDRSHDEQQQHFQDRSHDEQQQEPTTEFGTENEAPKLQESSSPDIEKKSISDKPTTQQSQISFLAVKENVSADEGHSMSSSSDGVDMSGDWKNLTTGGVGSKWGISVGGGKVSNAVKQRPLYSTSDADLSSLSTDQVKLLLARKY